MSTFICTLRINIEFPIEADNKEDARYIYYKLKKGRDNDAIDEILAATADALDNGKAELVAITESKN